MYRERKYPFQRVSIETGTGTPPETPDTVVDGTREQESQLDERRLSENLYTFQKRLQEEKDILQIEGDIEGTGDVGSRNTNFLVGKILASGNREMIKKLQEIINERVRDGAKIPVDGANGEKTKNALKVYYGIIPSFSARADTLEQDIDYNDPSIIGRNLSEVASEDEAMKLAEKIIPGFNEAKNQKEKKEAIAQYQKDHGIGIDGKIGKETYLEMWADDLAKRANDRIDELGIAPATLAEIQEFFEKNPKMLGGTMVAALRGTLDRFKKDHSSDENFQKKYGEFYSWYDKQEEVFQASPEGQAQREAIENAKGADGRSIYKMVKDGDWEQILMNPTLLIFAGLGFIFGMYGADTAMTDAWWKRILVLGFGLANADSIKDIVDDIKGNIPSTGEGSVYEATRNRVKEFAKETGITVANIDTEKIGDGFSSLINKFSSRNEQNRGDNTKYIEPEILESLNNALYGDRAFFNLTEEQRLEIQNSSDVKGTLLGIVGTEAKNILTEIDEKDIKNYIQYLYSPVLGGGHSLARYFKDSLRAIGGKTIETLGGSFTENERLDGIIKSDLAPFVQSLDTEKARAGNDIVNAILSVKVPGTTISLSASFGTFKIDDYQISSTERQELRDVIQKILFITAGEEHIKNQVTKIQTIAFVANGDAVVPDSVGSLKRKIEDLYAIQLDTTKLTGYTLTDTDFSVETFNAAFEEKKIELFRGIKMLDSTLINIDIPGIGTKNIEDTLRESESNRLLNEREAQVERLTSDVEDVPNVTATPLEFRKYYEENIAKFQEAQRISEAYPDTLPDGAEKNLGDRAREKLKPLTQLKENYEAIKTTYKDQVSAYETQITDVSIENVDETNFLERRRVLELIAQDHMKLRANVLEGYTIGDITTLWNRYMGERFVAEPSKDSFEFLDRELGSMTEKPKLEVTQGLVQDRAALLESVFITDIDMSSLNVDNDISVQDIIKVIEKKGEAIDVFETGQKQGKVADLQSQVDRVIHMYIENLQSPQVETLAEAQRIYASYIRNVENKVGGNIFGFGSLIVHGSAVEDTLNTKAKELQREEFLSTAITDAKVVKILQDTGVVDFFRSNVVNNQDIARIEDGLGSTTSVADILFNLDLILNYPSVNQEIKTNLRDIVKKLNDAIQIELEGYFTTYKQKIVEFIKQNI